MLLYYLFWMSMGFILHLYIIFGTNLLTEGPTQIAVFFLFQCFEGKGYQTESKRNETFGNVIFGTNVIQRTWSGRQAINEEATRHEGAPAPGRAPHPRAAATFYTREIPSWGLFRRSFGGGIDHGGLLHQHHSLSNKL